MSKVYTVELHAADDVVIAVTSTIVGVAAAILRECRLRRIRAADVDGTDIQAFVRTDDVDCQFEVCGWTVDHGPEEVTVDQLNELAAALGIE